MIESNKSNQLLGELQKRQEQVLKMGGEDKIEKQHNANRLTARERIDKLADKGSFFEMGMLAHSNLPEAKDKTPSDGKICGIATIDNAYVSISSDDVTVLAGSGGIVGYQKEFKVQSFAKKRGFPSIHLGDGGGARVPDIMGAVGMMNFTYDIQHSPRRDRKTPTITAIMGECYGGPTWEASTSDIVIQVKGSVMAVASSNVLESATSEKVESSTLGGWEMHAYTTGLVDFFADDDEEAIKLIKKTLTYLPPNYKKFPREVDFSAPSVFKQNKLLEIIPDDERYPYDMHQILESVFDLHSVFELKPFYDGSLITCFARLEGKVVGVLANNPKINAGAMGPGACEKATSFIALCDSYNIPMIFLHDTPGFYVSKSAEEKKMPVRIMNFINALHHCTMPILSVIIRKSYGMAHCNMMGARMGADFLMAWPNAQVSFVAPEVALNIVMGRKLKTEANPDSIKTAFLDEMQKMNAPWEAAGLNLIDKIIDPRQTRNELVKGLNISTAYKQRSKRLMSTWCKMM